VKSVCPVGTGIPDDAADAGSGVDNQPGAWAELVFALQLGHGVAAILCERLPRSAGQQRAFNRDLARRPPFDYWLNCPRLLGQKPHPALITRPSFLQ
jgi:hypothetical protein